MRTRALITAVVLVSACGGSAADESSFNSDGRDATGNNQSGEQNNTTGTNGGFEPEVEQFLVREVAATERFVFVPNSSDEGTTVARISGLDLSVTPIPVGLRPTDVVAFDSPAGAVAFVLVEGTSSVAIIRADAPGETPSDLVHLVSVPSEVNALRAVGDGRHVLAYIDPERPFPDDSSVASLQAAALLRLGDTPDADAAFELSLTRLIRDVEVVDEGRQLYVVGREGVNRLIVGDVTGDTFVPPLPLELSPDVFPPTDLEVEVADDASFLVVRSSAFEGISLVEVNDTGLGEPLLVPLPGVPTDIDLYLEGGARKVLATIRDESSVALIDVDEAIAATEPMPYAPQIFGVSGANPGLAQITPDFSQALLYSTLPLLPTMGIFDFATETVRTYPLRNAISSVAVSPDSARAIVLHDLRDEGTTFFQRNEGLTILDLASGYRRPITLQAKPVETVLATLDNGDTHVFVLLESPVSERQGLLRVDLQTFRTDFIGLARAPRQIGRVAGKIFVAQESDDGRITFVDADTLLQRTVSGYELNAGID